MYGGIVKGVYMIPDGNPGGPAVSACLPVIGCNQARLPDSANKEKYELLLLRRRGISLA
jgi:hypothetical protein